MQASRPQILFTVLAGVFLLVTALIFAIFALAPDVAVAYRPFLLTSFVITLFISLVCIAWLLRGLLRPYSQLVGEAKRAPVIHSSKTQNEAEFVLETFQTVIGRNVRLSEAPSYGQSILDYGPDSPGALAYRSLAEEVIARG